MVQYLKKIKFEYLYCVLFILSNLLSIFKRFATGTTKDIFTDDAYYYILPAINFIENGFYSFDSLNKTNGFHPLFEWILTVLLFFTGAEYDTYIIYITVLSFISLILVVLIFIIFKYAINIMRHMDGSLSPFFYALTVVLTLLFSWYLELYLNGMEAVLVLVFISMFSIAVYHHRFFTAGLFGVLIAASRLDTFVFFITPLAVIYSFSYFNKLKSAIRIFLKLVVPSLLFLIIYMTMNYLSFGEYKPIHGKLKSTFPIMNFQPHLIMTKHIFIVSVMAIIGIILNFFQKGKDYKMKLLSITLGIVTLIYIVNFGFFQKWSKMIPSWYYSIVYFTSFTSVTLSLIGFIKVKHLKYALLAFISVVFIYNVYGLKLKFPLKDIRPPYGNTSGIFDFLASTDKNDVFAKTDTGALAFWGDRHFINLDGLINNFDYQTYLKNGELNDYLIDKNVRYLVVDVFSEKNGSELMYDYRFDTNTFTGDYDSFSFYIYSYLYEEFSDEIKLYPCAEVFRTPVYKDGGVDAVTIFYDFALNKKCSQLMIGENE